MEKNLLGFMKEIMVSELFSQAEKNEIFEYVLETDDNEEVVLGFLKDVMAAKIKSISHAH